jgi:hypothetical protein
MGKAILKVVVGFQVNLIEELERAAYISNTIRT